MVRNINGDLILANRPFHLRVMNFMMAYDIIIASGVQFLVSKMASDDVKMSSGVTVVEFDKADISGASFKSQ